MKIELERNVYSVSLRKEEEKYYIKFLDKEKEYELDFCDNGKFYSIIIDNKPYVVNFTKNNDSIISSNMIELKVLDEKNEEKTKRRALKEVYTSSDKTLISKIPGKVLKVLVKENSSVKQGDVLFVLEAMKMENRIYAEKEAVIENVFVENNQNIMTGAKLLTYK
jgi:glutaconyl-CoA/methylmalonyl-CoA decarboxylase subunit gamma